MTTHLKITVLILWITFPLFASSIKDEATEVIQNYYGQQAKLTFKKYQLSPTLKTKIERTVKQRFFKSFVYLWTVEKKDSVIGYALLDNVLGKSLPITFLIFFEPTGHILHSEIIKYREPVGGAVANPRWNQQFSGRNKDSSFVIGKAINGVSGATISSHSLAKGYRKLSLLIEAIRK